MVANEAEQRKVNILRNNWKNKETTEDVQNSEWEMPT